ncbi:hypothetical protein BT63DRAFT_451215 [Microthyrium microscopicum]|uniref:DNA-directed RNA polymerase III subunit n=1 Tax=Microthyrium microscopicum TaxID=703497 RepID=A0A6A6ULM0_9PEZI|nr:hypothetical protein BT63DRAFT_451215 [Microthyrium microscopicum]
MPPRRGRGGRPFFQGRGAAPGGEKPAMYKPRELYPPIEVPKIVPLRKAEIAGVKSFRQYRKRIHDGPLYTILDPKARISKPGDLAGIWTLELAGTKTGEVDPFEGLTPTWTGMYRKARRPMPKLDERSYVSKMFPPELQVYVDPSAKAKAALEPKKSARALGGLDQDGEEDEEAEEIFEEEDDDFEDDEDDDDDYNAEQYFDGGDSDGGGDGGGGGGGGGDDF